MGIMLYIYDIGNEGVTCSLTCGLIDSTLIVDGGSYYFTTSKVTHLGYIGKCPIQTTIDNVVIML